jgi:hypothetical protein
VRCGLVFCREEQHSCETPRRITSSSASVDLNLNSNPSPRQVVFRWRTSEDDERHTEDRAGELREEGKTVIALDGAIQTAAKP